MYGTLRGALAGRKIEYDQESYRATVEGRIAGIGRTIHIKSINVHYELAVPAAAREATERALAAHPQGGRSGLLAQRGRRRWRSCLSVSERRWSRSQARGPRRRAGPTGRGCAG